MKKFRIEVDNGTGTFVMLDVEAEDQYSAEDMAMEQVKAAPGSDSDLVVIISTLSLE